MATNASSKSGNPCATASAGGTSVVPRVYAIGTTLFVHEQEGAYASSREIA